MSNDRRRTADLASGTNQLNGIDQFTTSVTLIAAGILVAATQMGTRTFDESISQKAITVRAEQLVNRLRLHESAVQQIVKQFLNDPVNIEAKWMRKTLCDSMRLLGLFGRRRSTEIVESNAEPAVDVVVNLKVFVANLLGRRFLGQGFCLRGRAIFIRATHEQCIVACGT